MGRARGARTPMTRRRRRQGGIPQQQPETSDEEDEGDVVIDDDEDVPSSADRIVPGENLSLMEREIRELEDEHVRRTNAYPGAQNTIGSVHQRRWYISLDRRACGFVNRRTKGRSAWELEGRNSDSHDGGSVCLSTGSDRLPFPFYVRGADYERSVVTGRRGADILEDEGVKNFVPRKGWTPVLN